MSIPIDPATREGMKAGRRTLSRRAAVREEYERVTRAWLPLLAAALRQPHPTMELQGEAERIRLSLEDQELEVLLQLQRAPRSRR